ncbi:zinc finger protein 540-like [Trichogramma pretiosum]|uniref:zinc finger protein 540-like n=1 Tax=Trichogramma pretiosum TaxID=7493 RepID=UPI0006C9BDFF|nr:zinc finger protein 540-like [Trichogramma pretiosum]
MESSSIFNCAVKVKNEPCDVSLAENYCKSIDKTPNTNDVQCSKFLLENTTNKLQKYEETYEAELEKMEIDFECKDVKLNVDSLIFKNRQKTIKVETAAVVKQEFCGDNATKLVTKLDCELKKQNKKRIVTKKLNRKHKLKKTIATMRGDITRTCDKCDKTFTSKYYLKIHIDSVHNGVTYACDKCDKTFTSKYYIKIHIDSVHNGVNYACDKCGKTFTSKGYRKLHINWDER